MVPLWSYGVRTIISQSRSLFVVFFLVPNSPNKSQSSTWLDGHKHSWGNTVLVVKSTNFEATMLKSDSWLCHWLWMSYLAWPLYVADGIIIVPNYLIGLLQGLNEFEKVRMETLGLKHYFWFWKKKKLRKASWIAYMFTMTQN